METAELARLRDHYRRLTDAKLEELHAEGPAAYAAPEVWQILDEEFQKRGTNAAGIEDGIVEEWRESLKQTEVEARLQAQRAGAAERVAATAIDLLLLWLVGYLLVTAFGEGGALAYLLIVLTYHPLTEFIAQRTLGKAVLGLRLVTTSGSAPALPAVLIRHLARPLIGGLIWLAIYETFAVHDIWSRTRVIRSRQLPRSSG